jgi:hypothetical protein
VETRGRDASARNNLAVSSVVSVMGSKSNSAARLGLAFAWVGAAGGWYTASTMFSDGGWQGSEKVASVATLLLTPILAWTFGWLLGRSRYGVAGKCLLFVVGAVFVGATNGFLIALFATLAGLEGAAVLFGPILGAALALPFVPVLGPALVAELRVGRARPRSVVGDADARTVAVVSAGVTAMAASALGLHASMPWMVRTLALAGCVVGGLALWEDRSALLKLSDARRLHLKPRIEPRLEQARAPRVDLGLGDEVRESVSSAYAAYRDAPKVEMAVRGDPTRATWALRVALVIDSCVVAGSVLAFAFGR